MLNPNILAVSNASSTQKEQILSTLEEILVLGSQASQVEQEVKEFRFSKGKVCPLCASETISRNGKYNGKQRYICCTDSNKSYIQFANDLSLEHKRIKRGKHKEVLYHIQHINALHSNLKKWMNMLNGVATKYISNYIKWFKAM